MTEIEAIRARHSVRSYQDKPIETETVSKLTAMIEDINKESGLHLQLLVDAGDTFNRMLSRVMGLGSAPSVIACIGPDNESLDETVGYYGEKLVLYAQQLGLNTCWAGTYNAKNVKAQIGAGERLAIVIAIGYGTQPGKNRRSKTAEQVVKGGIEGKPAWFMAGVEMALLAPTAVNQQKFELELTADGQGVVIDKGGILSKIDKGIVRYHFEVGAASAR